MKDSTPAGLQQKRSVKDLEFIRLEDWIKDPCMFVNTFEPPSNNFPDIDSGQEKSEL